MGRPGVLALAIAMASCGQNAVNNSDGGRPADLALGGSTDLAGIDLAVPVTPRLDFAGLDIAGIDFATNPPDLAACGAGPSLKLTTILSGLSQPTFVTSAPGDASQLFVLERAGVIKLAKSGVVNATPYLDLTAQVFSTGDDDGLLGFALHPDYATNGRLFVDFTDKAHKLEVLELGRAAGAPDTANPTVVKTLVSLDNAALIRYGGMLAFGRDGFLYIGVGDGAPDGDPSHNALNLSLQLGKILRIDVDRFPTAPTGNMTGTNVDPQIWDYGVREPWRFSFDRMTGDLYLADVGHPTYQEIDIEAAGAGGHNFGWSTMAGTHCVQAGCTQTGLTLPATEYSGGGSCAIIGGYVYRGTRNPCMQGWYIYSDYCSKKVKAILWNGSQVTGSVDVTSALGTPGALSSFGEDADGELYVVDYTNGRVSRIDAN